MSEILDLDETLLQDAIIDVRGRHFRDWESRLSRYGALKAFIDNSDLLLPKSLVEKSRTAARRPQKIAVLDKMDVEIIDKRSCNIVGNNGVSRFATLSWQTKGFEIIVAPARNADNYISLEEDYAHQMLNALIKVFGELDIVAANALETNKATSLAATELAQVAAGAYQMSIDDIYFYMQAIMEKNDLYGPYLDVANTEAIASWKKYWESFGLNNEQNKAGVADRYVPYRSNRVTPGASNSEVHYFAAQGSIGVFNWNHWEAQHNADFKNGTSVTIKEDPVLGLKWAVTTKIECRDLSATLGEGYEATWVKAEQWVSDFAFVAAYSSDNMTPIIKAVIPKTVTPAPEIISFTSDEDGGEVPQEIVFSWTALNVAAGYRVLLDLGLGGAPINVTAVSTYTHEYTAAGNVTAELIIVDSGNNEVDSATIDLTFTE